MTDRQTKLLHYLTQHHYLEVAQLSHLWQVSPSTTQTVILAAHTKIGKVNFARFCALTEVNLLITDEGLSSEQREALERAGLQVLVASG